MTGLDLMYYGNDLKEFTHPSVILAIDKILLKLLIELAVVELCQIWFCKSCLTLVVCQKHWYYHRPSDIKISGRKQSKHYWLTLIRLVLILSWLLVMFFFLLHFLYICSGVCIFLSLSLFLFPSFSLSIYLFLSLCLTMSVSLVFSCCMWVNTIQN